MPEPKREEAGSLSKSERQELQTLYTQVGVAHGSASNLVQASNRPVSKERQLLEILFTKFTLATGKFKRMKAFASFKKEICCMNFPYKLVKETMV